MSFELATDKALDVLVLNTESRPENRQMQKFIYQKYVGNEVLIHHRHALVIFLLQ